MSLDWTDYFSIVLTLAAGLAASGGVLSVLDQRRRARRANQQALAHEASANEAVSEALKRAAERLTSSMPSSSSADELRKLISLLEARLEAIEDRLPDTETIDKIASVNDAILATKLEEVDRTLTRLEQNQMSTGRVFGLISAFLGVLFALAALIPWIVDRIVTALQ
ncbi:hypothetical protein [Cellulosimicrobium composti]|uniref:hypothetical protein n=1 Tax=Cellulosimicrobium composti TaxID=2672572 RepID=UPI0037B8EBAF